MERDQLAGRLWSVDATPQQSLIYPRSLEAAKVCPSSLAIRSHTLSLNESHRTCTHLIIISAICCKIVVELFLVTPIPNHFSFPNVHSRHSLPPQLTQPLPYMLSLLNPLSHSLPSSSPFIQHRRLVLILHLYNIIQVD